MTAEEERIRAALPGYDIEDQIGRGGCGVVLFGTHRKLQRPVAIKQIPTQFAENQAVRRRFVAEARLMAVIDHPHVVPVYDYVEHDDLCLLVMEYLAGGTVASRFTTQGFDAAAAVAVTLACAAGLEAAHRHGVLHRDIKPANLMFAANGTVKLTDFGIAKIVGGNDTLVTRAGDVVGTPCYIAPEQARGQQVSPATDVYALATTLYQLLSGVLPFPTGGDSMAVLFMHAFEKPTPLSEVAPAVPKPIADVVMRGLATDPVDRFESAESFGIALAEPAADVFGCDWLTPVGIPVIGADTIVAAATGGGHLSSTSRTTATLSRTLRTERIRPAEPLERARVALADVAPRDVAPVRRVVKFRSARVPFIVSIVLAAAAIGLALMGLGAAPRGGDLPAGTVTVGGADPTSGVPVTVDMSQSVPVTVAGVAGDRVALSLDMLGATVGRHEAPLVPSEQGSSAALPPPVNRYLLGGNTTAHITVLQGQTPVADYRFGVRSTQPATRTAAAVATVVVALFAAAYIESSIRALRRGRSRVSANLTLPLSASLLGLAAVGGAWILTGTEPTRPTVAGVAAVAGAAGVAAAVGAMRVGRRARYRRRRARIEAPA
jgi:hypothetical protein